MAPLSSDMDLAASLRLENGMAWSSDLGAKVGVAPLTPSSPGASGTCCSEPDAGKDRRGNICSSIFLGQVLSALIAMMSMSAASLHDRGVNLPSFLNLVNYSTLTVVFFFPMLVTRGYFKLSLPWWRYALYALVDVEANTLTVLAFRYTSITSVAMLDAFSIPTVMVLSRLFLHAHYTSKHLMGVVLCLGGLALTIVSDLNKHTPNADYPQALRGDILCILGAALYAGSNVMQEDFVKNHNRVEFLGMAGVFGVVITGVQTLWLEREAIAEVEWTDSIILFTMGYALSLSVMYSWTSLFLEAGDAAMFNLSLLTSDVYALLFSFLVEHVTPNWLYFVAFGVIFSGLILYHAQPPPTNAAPVRLELDHDEAFGRRGSGGQWSGDESDGRRSAFFELQDSSGSTYCSSGGGLSDLSEPESPPPSPDTDVSLI